MPTAGASEAHPLGRSRALPTTCTPPLTTSAGPTSRPGAEEAGVPGSWALRLPAGFAPCERDHDAVGEGGLPSKETIWAHWADNGCDSLAELVAGLPPFQLRFTRLQVSTAAVHSLAEPVPEIEQSCKTQATPSKAGLKPGQPSGHSPLHPGSLWCLRGGVEGTGDSSTRCRAHRQDDSGVPRGVKRARLPTLPSISLARLQLGTTLTIRVILDPSRVAAQVVTGVGFLVPA